ncbi:unnamed protein product [Effrenium voratum]|nr:unnamed protein product [Effrenium voratum]
MEARPLEPRVLNGCGMRVLGFVPLGGLATKALKVKTPKASKVQESKEIEKPRLVKGPSSFKKGRAVYEHGNYSSYYGYRHSEPDSSGDRRLTALTERFGKGFFKGKEVLDVGCNSGNVSISCALDFRASLVVAMDLDAGLIEAACENFNTREHPRKAKCSVEFRNEDILSCPLRRPPDDLPERFDVVICFSVTKWIHFAHGDTGLHNLFKRCFKRTRPGGFFVLEPQEWSSYKKSLGMKRHLTRQIREMVASIQIRPEDFDDYLETLGFEKVDTIEPPGDLPKNFQRSLRIFRRPDEEKPEAKPRKRKGPA